MRDEDTILAGWMGGPVSSGACELVPSLALYPNVEVVEATLL